MSQNNVTQPEQNRNTPQRPQNLLSRRRFLTGLVATVPLVTLNHSSVPAPDPTPTESLPRREVLDRLAQFKEQFQPLFDLLAYVEKAAYLPAGQINTDLLVQLWNDSDNALFAGREALNRREFERDVMYRLVGKDMYRLACARNMPGYEL